MQLKATTSLSVVFWPHNLIPLEYSSDPQHPTHLSGGLEAQANISVIAWEFLLATFFSICNQNTLLVLEDGGLLLISPLVLKRIKMFDMWVQNCNWQEFNYIVRYVSLRNQQK